MACDTHPTVPERRACTECGKRWCLDCVKKVGVQQREICPSCGHLVEKAAPEQTGDQAFVDAARRAISVEGLTTAAGFAVFYLLSHFLGILVIFYLSALVGYYFTIIHFVGDGGEGLPGPSDAVDDWLSTILLAFRGILCVLIGAAPLIIWVAVLGRMPPIGLAVLLLVAGQLYMPAVLLSVVFSNSTLAVAWPFAWAKVIAAAPKQYMLFALMWIASVIAGLMLFSLAGAIFQDWVPGRFIVSMIWNLFWFAQAGFVGLYLRNNAKAYGWHR